jgi:hypothetical protein
MNYYIHESLKGAQSLDAHACWSSLDATLFQPPSTSTSNQSAVSQLTMHPMTTRNIHEQASYNW